MLEISSATLLVMVDFHSACPSVRTSGRFPTKSISLHSWLTAPVFINYLSAAWKAMHRLQRVKQQLDEEASRMLKKLHDLSRRVKSDVKVEISDVQRKAARGLLVLRNGEPTTAMGFLRARRKGAELDEAA